MGLKTSDLEEIYPHGDVLMRQVAERSPTILLAFSGGKDSLATWLELRRFGGFERIIPFYRYLIPDLDFVEKSITRYEEIFATRIYRLPHPSLYRMLNNLVFQPPENCAVIERYNLPNFDYEDLTRELLKTLKLPATTYTANGVRVCDSPIRRIALQKYGPSNTRQQSFMPCWNWNKARVYSEIERAGIKLPIDYELFGRSFDGIDYRFLRPIRDCFPADFKKILKWFPLAELELLRREYYAGHKAV